MPRRHLTTGRIVIGAAGQRPYRVTVADLWPALRCECNRAPKARPCPSCGAVVRPHHHDEFVCARLGGRGER